MHIDAYLGVVGRGLDHLNGGEDGDAKGEAHDDVCASGDDCAGCDCSYGSCGGKSASQYAVTKHAHSAALAVMPLHFL